MVEATDRPSRIAHIEAPLPRWAITRAGGDLRRDLGEPARTYS